MRKELHRSLQMHAGLQPLGISRVCGAPSVPVTARGVRRRDASASRLRPAGVGADGLAGEIGSGVDESTLPGPRTVFLRSGAVASGVTWHVAAKMA